MFFEVPVWIWLALVWTALSVSLAVALARWFRFVRDGR
jgi:hypothetical protein